MKFVILIFTNLLLLKVLSIEIQAVKKKNTYRYKSHSLKASQDILDKLRDTLENKKDELSEGKIYYQTWVKYFHYNNGTEITKPKSFYHNQAYFIQQKYKENEEESKNLNEFGPLSIPNEVSFFAVLFRDTLNLLSSRKDNLMMTIDILNIDFIKTIPEEEHLAGGIRDFGSFKEGFCFKVLTTNPNKYFKMSIESPAPSQGLNEIWDFLHR